MSVHSDILEQNRYKHIHRMKYMKIILAPFILMLRFFLAVSRMCKLEYVLFYSLYRPMSKKNFAKMDRAFAKYTPTEKDVFICSYFKSGTNWMMQIAYQVVHRGKGEFEFIHDVVPWPDLQMNWIVSLEDESSSHLRVIKTHLIADMVPYNEKAKYICVVRDPKDVFVSSYFFTRSIILGKLMPSVKTWLKIFLSEAAMHGSWGRFLHSYWLWRNRSNVLFISYEDIKDDLDKAIHQVANLIGVKLTSDEFEQVKYKSSFSYMKSIDEKFYPGCITPFSLPKGTMIRSGKKGHSKELITDKQQKQIDEYQQQHLQNLGCDFPYQDYYSLKHGNRK